MADRKLTFLPPMAEAFSSFLELFFGDLDLPWNLSRLVQGLVMFIATMHGNFGDGKKLFYLNQTHIGLRLPELISTTRDSSSGFSSYCSTIGSPCMKLKMTEHGGEGERKGKSRGSCAADNRATWLLLGYCWLGCWVVG